MQEAMIKRACELLSDGSVQRVLGHRKGEFVYDVTPAVFESADELNAEFVMNAFCVSNLSKYLVKLNSKEGKTLVFLKPCDTYSFNQLVSEHRVNRENVYVIGVECNGMADIETMRRNGFTGVKSVEFNADGTCNVTTAYGNETVPAEKVCCDKCLNCKSRKHVAYDELIGQTGEVLENNRFDMVARLEAMTPDERFEFWRGEISKCIRCNACRNACPACTCEKCIFDNPASGVDNKAVADSFEENMFHIIRAFHVAGRCTDCGECSRVCPQNIPLHLLNRKIIKDTNEFYGEYQAGETVNERGPLVSYTQGDCEPSIVHERGNG